MAILQLITTSYATNNPTYRNLQPIKPLLQYVLLVIQIDVLEFVGDVSQDSLFLIFVSRHCMLGIQTKMLLSLITTHDTPHHSNIGAQKNIINNEK